MAAGLEEALAAGCAGLSIGLIYAPACYAEDDEIEALCRVVARSGGYLAVHMRNESDRMAAAVDESLALARRTGVRLQLSHLKASGQANWPQLLPALRAIEAARAEGVSVSCDQYPYVAGSTTITVLLPQWALDGGVDAMLARLRDPAIRDGIRRDFAAGIPGWDCLVRANGWDNILVSWAADGGQAFEGRTLADIGHAAGDPAEALFDLILRLRGQASIVVFQQSEENVEAAMRRPYVAIGSDGLHAGVRAHPRLYGTFPRVLGRYVRERGTLGLAEAVRKMTSLPADVLGRADRGRLAEGCAADVTVFVPEVVADTGTFAEPDRPPRGIRHVVVNGVPVVQDGSHTGARPGAILRRG
jgi:dihydroorotase/N-acyl-D-amino-acid deacylase